MKPFQFSQKQFENVNLTFHCLSSKSYDLEIYTFLVSVTSLKASFIKLRK